MSEQDGQGFVVRDRRGKGADEAGCANGDEEQRHVPLVAENCVGLERYQRCDARARNRFQREEKRKGPRAGCHGPAKPDRITDVHRPLIAPQRSNAKAR